MTAALVTATRPGQGAIGQSSIINLGNPSNSRVLCVTSVNVADGLRRRNRVMEIGYMVEREGGSFLGHEDSACLREAATQGLTRVTYDRRTIPPLLKTWAEEEQPHGGVVFVDEKTISPADIGGLVWALTRLVRETGNWDWTNRIYFLRR